MSCLGPVSARGERDVLGTTLQVTTYDELTAFCHRHSREENCVTVDFSNTHIVTMRRHDPTFRHLTEAMDYFIPDGMPLIWCLNRLGAGLRDRIYGPTFLRRFICATPNTFSHYFLGGSPECLGKLLEVLTREKPDMRIAGSHHGYFRPDEEESIIAEINRLAPDFIWVGLGTPKQQEWIRKHKPQIPRGVVFAVGFAFDVNAGTKRDAPAWMQKAGLTWLFRVASEPRRLFTRYLRYNSLFVYYLLRDGLRKK